MNDYNRAQVDYRDRCKERIKRQMEICRFLGPNTPVVVRQVA